MAAQVDAGLARASCAHRLLTCLTPACYLTLQVDAALSAEQLCLTLQPAFQQEKWQWAYLLRMAMTFMPAILGRSDDLYKLPWNCLAVRTRMVQLADLGLWFLTESCSLFTKAPTLNSLSEQHAHSSNVDCVNWSWAAFQPQPSC